MTSPTPPKKPIKDLFGDISRSRAVQGFSPSGSVTAQICYAICAADSALLALSALNSGC